MFLDLDEDLEKLEQATHLFAGTVTTSANESDGIVIVAMHDNSGNGITGFRMLSTGGPFEIRADKKQTWLFAFFDRNHDLIFQKNESYAWANGGNPLENKFGNYVKLNVGTISSLDDALFSMRQAEKGLWQPFEFTEDGGAGIHFTEEFDPDRIPVLFVHGINGTPQNFRRLIEDLDKSRYQAWVAWSRKGP